MLVYGTKKRATSARLAGQGKKTPIKRRKMKVHNAQELIIDEITELVCNTPDQINQNMTRAERAEGKKKVHFHSHTKAKL